MRRVSRRPQWPCEGGRGRRARAPPSQAARGAEGAEAQAGAARGACARRPKGLCEGTLRRDFSKGLSKGLSKDFNIYTWFQLGRKHCTRRNAEHHLPELEGDWDDNNRFKPRMTTVTTLATRGAALYIGGRRSVIRRARRGCRRVCRRGGLSAPDRITRPGLTLYSVNAVFRRKYYSARVTSYQHDQHTK